MSASLPSPIRVLAVDDEPDSLELISGSLSQPGVEILTSTDSEEGWQLVRTKHPEIVVLDLVMPKLSGMQLLERIVDWDPGIDVVLLTANYSTDSAVEAIRKGACDYLTKPLPPAALRARIGTLLDGARQLHRVMEL